MPSLRLTFLEKDSPVVLALRGPRISIGRRPDNVIQLRDRTVSAYHAELILEDDHYRLHDLGATNGVLVNGEIVADYHLREACEIAFGEFRCEFNPEAVDPAESGAEVLATREEVAAMARENAELKQRNATNQVEMENLRRAHAALDGGSVPQSEHNHLVEECAALQRAGDEQTRALAQAREELAILQRERKTLQRDLEKPGEPAAASPAVDRPRPAAEIPPEPSAATQTVAAPPAAVPAAKPQPLFVPSPSRPISSPEKPTPANPAPGSSPRPAVPAPAFAAGPRPAVSSPGIPSAARPLQPTVRPVPNLNRPPATSTQPPRPLPAGVKLGGGPAPTARPGTPLPPIAKPAPVQPKPAATPIGPKGTQKVSP